MSTVTRVALHTGTGTQTVLGIMDRLGIHTEVVKSPRQLETVKFDGLLLLGGSDIAPFYYGEKNKYSENPDDNRDFIEWHLIRQAMSKKLPIMGICRGHQMITIAHGGSLFQDIYRQNATHEHGTPHRVKYTGNLANYAASDIVNSLHHQAARTVPDGFKTLAKSPDGIIESIWKPGVLGVQWHPELMYSQDYRWGKLFEWFASGLQ